MQPKLVLSFRGATFRQIVLYHFSFFSEVFLSIFFMFSSNFVQFAKATMFLFFVHLALWKRQIRKNEEIALCCYLFRLNQKQQLATGQLCSVQKQWKSNGILCLTKNIWFQENGITSEFDLLRFSLVLWIWRIFIKWYSGLVNLFSYDLSEVLNSNLRFPKTPCISKRIVQMKWRLLRASLK